MDKDIKKQLIEKLDGRPAKYFYDNYLKDIITEKGRKLSYGYFKSIWSGRYSHVDVINKINSQALKYINKKD